MPRVVPFVRVSPVLPVRDIARAIEHYRRLGLAVRLYEGPDAYAFAERDGIEFHMAQVNNLVPRRNMSAVYLYVDDADALYEEWSSLDFDGRLIEPRDTEYGLLVRGVPGSGRQLGPVWLGYRLEHPVPL